MTNHCTRFRSLLLLAVAFGVVLSLAVVEFLA